MRIFLAGATGATGRTFVNLATGRGHDLVLHVRPKTAARSPLSSDPRARVFELSDEGALGRSLEGVDAVVSMVGTMRSRFAAGDTYESADVGSTRQLVTAAKAAGVSRFLLLSSIGAGGLGAYLQMKGECERLVRESGLRWTIFRPSMLVSQPGAPEGTHGHRPRSAAWAALFFDLLERFPGVSDWSADVRPIPLDVVGRAFLAVLEAPRDGQVLSGRDLWRLSRSL